MVAEHVVYKPRSSAVQDNVRIGQWVGKVIKDDGIAQVRVETGQRVAQVFLRLYQPSRI